MLSSSSLLYRLLCTGKVLWIDLVKGCRRTGQIACKAKCCADWDYLDGSTLGLACWCWGGLGQRWGYQLPLVVQRARAGSGWLQRGVVPLHWILCPEVTSELKLTRSNEGRWLAVRPGSPCHWHKQRWATLVLQQNSTMAISILAQGLRPLLRLRRAGILQEL
jgi:hypothetical protein